MLLLNAKCCVRLSTVSSALEHTWTWRVVVRLLLCLQLTHQQYTCTQQVACCADLTPAADAGVALWNMASNHHAAQGQRAQLDMLHASLADTHHSLARPSAAAGGVPVPPCCLHPPMLVCI